MGADPAAWFSWLIIIVIVITLLVLPLVLPSTQLYSVEDPAIPAVLRLQGRMIYGVHRLGQNDPAMIGQIEGLTATVGSAWGVAALKSAMSSDLTNDREAIRRLLERFDDQITDPDTLEIHEAVKRTTMTPSRATPADWRMVEDHLDWFGQVLSAEKNSATTFSAEELGSKALTKALVLMGFMVVALLLGVVGLLLLIVGSIMVSRGSLRMRPIVRLQAHPNLYLQAFAVFLAMAIIADFVVVGLQLTSLAAAAGGVVIAVGVGYFWPGWRGVPRCPLWTDLGISRGNGIMEEVAAGVIGYLAVLPFFGLGVLMTIILAMYMALVQGTGQEPQPALGHPAIEAIANGDISVRLAILFLAACVAPFVEEIIFRGTFFAALRERHGFVFSAFMTAFVFAAIHPQGFIAIPALMSLAVGFALLREWRGSLVAPMTAHALHNGVLVTIVCYMLS